MKKKESKKKTNKTSYILVGLFTIISVIGIIYSVNKTFFVKEYTYIPEDVEGIVKGLKVRNEIIIHKKEIEEDNYIVEDNIKIRNDFEGFDKEEKENEFAPTRYILYEDSQIKEAIYIGTIPQYIDIFTSDDLEFFGEMDDDSTITIKEKFTKADRKNFLIKNNIKNDIDFITFIRENYYLKSNMFMSKKKIMENYAFNLITSIAIPKVDSITLVKGDYNGYIFNTSKMRSINIIKDDKLYVFSVIGDKFQDDSYLEDILSTLVIE